MRHVLTFPPRQPWVETINPVKIVVRLMISSEKVDGRVVCGHNINFFMIVMRFMADAEPGRIRLEDHRSLKTVLVYGQRSHKLSERDVVAVHVKYDVELFEKMAEGPDRALEIFGFIFRIFSLADKVPGTSQAHASR